MEKRLFNATIHLLTMDSVIYGTFLNSHTVVDVTVQRCEVIVPAQGAYTSSDIST